MNTQVAQQDNNPSQLQNYSDNLVMDIQAMNHMMNVATFMSSGTATLPAPYQKNPANCLAVVMQAAQWKMNPFSVAQKTHFVNGTIGYEAQLVSAVIQQSGAVKGMFEFEWFGEWEKIIGKFKEVESKSKQDDYGKPKKFKVPAWELKDEEGLGIRVSAILKGETEPRVLQLLLTQATTRNSTLWADDPKQQIAYLAQKRWARLYAPGVILGVYTADELETIAPEKDVTDQGSHETKPAEPVYLTDDEFKVNAEAWQKTYFKGVKKGNSTEDFYVWVDAKGKKLTEAQKEEIAMWKEPVIEGELVNDTFLAELNAAESEQ